jgi:hypothetical protein
MTWLYIVEHGENIYSIFRLYWPDCGKQISPLNQKKCQFGMRSCTYLGHVGNGQVKPELAKLVAVRAFPAFHQETGQGISWL